MICELLGSVLGIRREPGDVLPAGAQIAVSAEGPLGTGPPATLGLIVSRVRMARAMADGPSHHRVAAWRRPPEVGFASIGVAPRRHYTGESYGLAMLSPMT